MSVALVVTARDEEELLRANLLYHHHQGVEQVFVYSDGSTDGTLASVQSLPFVRAGASVGAARFAGRPELARAVARAGTHVTARQVLNTCDAMERAREAGCTWLLSIDADELVCAELARAEPGMLRALLDGMPATVQCVSFPTLEVVQRATEYGNVFAEATLFKREGARIGRRVLDPRRGTALTARGFYGHADGKSAVRLDADALPRSTHRFVARDGAALATVAAGHLLHYYCYSFGAFLAKFRRFSDHPDVHHSGAPVQPLKRLWRDVVNDPRFSAEDLRAYYRAWVAFDERRLRRLRRSSWLGIVPRRSPVVEVSAPREVFRALAEATAGARP